MFIFLIPLSQRHPPIIRIRIMQKNSIKIVFTNSEHPKIICNFIYEHPLKKIPWKDRWACGEGVTFDRALEIVRIILELRSQIRSLVPMRLLCVWLQHRKSADYSGPVPILRPNNANIIRIIEFEKGVLVRVCKKLTIKLTFS